MKAISGIYAALLSVFDAEGRPDAAGIARLVDWNVELGTEGLYVCGSTGEAMMLDSDARKAILEAAVTAATGRVPVVAQVGCPDLSTTIDLARHADALGVVAISAVMPYYYRFSSAEVQSYYRRLADAVATPLLLYFYPGAAGQSLGLPELLALLEHQNIIGLKYTATDFYVLERIRQGAPDAVIMNGFDEMSLAGFASGADGSIGSTVNLMAPLFREVYDAVESGDITRARERQARINSVIDALLPPGVIPALKGVLNHRGVAVGDARAPFAMPDAETVRGIDSIYEAAMNRG